MSKCPNCGKECPPERETGYNGDDFCSLECEESELQRKGANSAEGRDAMTEQQQRYAEWELEMHLRRFAAKHSDDADYFDPRNKDLWLESFGRYLTERKVEFASND